MQGHHLNCLTVKRSKDIGEKLRGKVRPKRDCEDGKITVYLDPMGTADYSGKPQDAGTRECRNQDAGT